MPVGEPVIHKSEAAILQSAANVLRDIEARGYVDFNDLSGGHDIECVADALDDLVNCFDGCLERADP